VGGVGSLAYWTDSKDAGTAVINSGSLSLSSPVCTGTGLHDWQLENGDAFVPGTTKIVPGDTINKICDLSLVLAGAHIGATLAIDAASITPAGALATALTPTATFLVDGVAYAPIVDPGTYTVRATVGVVFTTAAVNTSQNGTVNLNAINITATQTHSP